MNFFEKMGSAIKDGALKAGAGIELEMLRNQRREIDEASEKLRGEYAKLMVYSAERKELMLIIESSNARKTEWKVSLVSIPDSVEEQRKKLLTSMYTNLLTSIEKIIEVANASLKDIVAVTGDLDEEKFTSEQAKLADKRVEIEKRMNVVRETVHR